MSRSLTAIIASPTGVPREGALMEFVNGSIVSAITDAGGVFLAVLDTGTLYTLGVSVAVQIDGVPYPAGTVFTITVPEGDGTATFAESLVSTIDASPAALLARIVAIESALQIPIQEPVLANPPVEGEAS